MCMHLDEMYLPNHNRGHWVKGQGHGDLFRKNLNFDYNFEVFLLTASKLHMWMHLGELYPPDYIRGHGVKGQGHRDP